MDRISERMPDIAGRDVVGTAFGTPQTVDALPTAQEEPRKSEEPAPNRRPDGTLTSEGAAEAGRRSQEAARARRAAASEAGSTLDHLRTMRKDALALAASAATSPTARIAAMREARAIMADLAVHEVAEHARSRAGLSDASPLVREALRALFQGGDDAARVMIDAWQDADQDAA